MGNAKRQCRQDTFEKLMVTLGAAIGSTATVTKYTVIHKDNRACRLMHNHAMDIFGRLKGNLTPAHINQTRIFLTEWGQSLTSGLPDGNHELKMKSLLISSCSFVALCCDRMIKIADSKKLVKDFRDLKNLAVKSKAVSIGDLSKEDAEKIDISGYYMETFDQIMNGD